MSTSTHDSAPRWALPLIVIAAAVVAGLIFKDRPPALLLAPPSAPAGSVEASMAAAQREPERQPEPQPAPTPSPEQLATRMHEPVAEAARIRVGHVLDTDPAVEYDLIGRDNRVIQAAIDTVAALDAGDAPRIVEIGPGRFLMRDSLHLRSHVVVRGTPGRTVLVKAPAATSRLVLDGDYGEEQITVAEPDGFAVGNGVAVWDDNVKYFHITVARITGRTGADGTFTLDQPLRGDCMVKRNAVAATVFPVVSGYDVRGVRLEHLEIDGSRDTNPFLDGCRGGGIYLSRGYGAQIHGCTVHGYNGDGISFQQSNDVVITDTVCRDNAGHGFHPGSGSHRTVMRRCRAEGNGEDGMFVCWRVKHGTFEENVFAGNRRNGISIGHKDTDNLLRSNTIRANASDGILFRDEIPGMAADRNRIEGNTIEDNGSPGRAAAGIRIRGVTADNVFVDNVIRDTRPEADRGQATGIAIEAAAGANAVSDNRIEAAEPIRDERRRDQP
ncbi:MAG: right-handed parallel beta-helix repeat-containing protein [Planctomycetia bacterium]